MFANVLVTLLGLGDVGLPGITVAGVKPKAFGST